MVLRVPDDDGADGTDEDEGGGPDARAQHVIAGVAASAAFALILYRMQRQKSKPVLTESKAAEEYSPGTVRTEVSSHQCTSALSTTPSARTRRCLWHAGHRTCLACTAVHHCQERVTSHPHSHRRVAS